MDAEVITVNILLLVQRFDCSYFVCRILTQFTQECPSYIGTILANLMNLLPTEICDFFPQNLPL